MPVILKIGHQFFLFKSEAQGATVLKALSNAVLVERDYERVAHKDTFTPDTKSRPEISLTVVRADQIKTPPKRITDERRLIEDRKESPFEP